MSCCILHNFFHFFLKFLTVFSYFHRQMAPKKMKTKKQLYLKEQMQSAIDAVNNDGMTVTEASRVFGIPRQTLKDRISCKYQRAGAGRPSELTEEEESALVNYVKFMADSGHPLTVLQIKAFASGIMSKRSNDPR